MPWDKDGYCTICQRHLNDNCICPGSDRERRQRRRLAAAEAPEAPEPVAPRRVQNEPAPMGPHPADGHQDHPSGPDGPDGAAGEPVTLPGIPAYPVKSLAGPLANLVSSTTLPAALVAGAGLAALAGLCGQADLIMPDGSPVRSALWVALVAPRGAGKTPSMDKAFSKLRELDAAAHDEYRTLLSEKGPGGAVLKDPTRRIDDATLEVVARYLNRGDGTGVVEADELSGWLQSIGQYKRVNGDKARWLSMWSSQPWRYQRVGDSRSGIGIDIYIDRPVISVVGGIQPHLHNLLGDSDSGFRPRWLPHLAPLETIIWGSRVHPAAEWESALEKLFWIRERRQWELSGDALREWQQACIQWKRQARGSENTSTSAALDKSDIQSARIALVIAESMFPGRGGVIPVKAIRCAIAITDYVMDCWRALPGHESFALSRRDEILNTKVDELANWLETRDGKRATRTQIKDAHIAGVRTTGDLDILLAAYIAVYPGTIREHQPEGGGRPGRVVCAPPRGSRDTGQSLPAHTSGVSGRPETPRTGVAQVTDAKPQVARSRGVSGQVARNSVARNSVARNSVPQDHDSPLCEICRNPLDLHLAASGETTHPGCAAEPAGTRHSERMPA